ncbi:hypothetical protein SAMN04488512_102326 [Sulfitobacter litoralis]|uniref:Uncharacterized protein n=1 Tax=Sulfitobacter litoralis TaxID=335975 RepID=A0ABY0RRV8_9RHOB|nr:hypothetical protein [Sulfitobacter litoralis]SDO40674.1 hypothetical protein SAMN04488512_102326 [Sulfitobacter litoralis]
MILKSRGPGVREAKRRRLESVVSEVEASNLQDNEMGLSFKRVSKASLIKKARLGKNYIDKLDADDPLFKRIEHISKSAETVAQRRDIESYRITKIECLEETIKTLRKMISEITDENTRFRIELNYLKEDLAQYQSDYDREHRSKPDLRVVKDDEIVSHPKEYYDE